MICKNCNRTLHEKTTVCPYCNTKQYEEYPDDISQNKQQPYEENFEISDDIKQEEQLFEISNNYNKNGVFIREISKKNNILFCIVSIFCILLIIAAVVLWILPVSANAVLKKGDCYEIASICAENPEELSKDDYSKDLLQAIANLEALHQTQTNDDEKISQALKDISLTSNHMVRERAINACANIETESLYLQINQNRNLRHKTQLVQNETLENIAETLMDFYKEQGNSYQEQIEKITHDFLPDAESLYHAALFNCATASDGLSQYNNDPEKNILTTTDFKEYGIAGTYDPETKMFHFIILAQ